jgi:beta-glucosidase
MFISIISFQLCNNVKESPKLENRDEKPIYLNPNYSTEERVEDLLSRMTLLEKIGQMTQVDRRFLNEEDDIKDYYLGSILSGGGSTPKPNTPVGWVEMYDNFQSYALQTRLRIPIIYGIDAVHGHNNVYGAVIFPHNIGMGCTRNPKLVEEAARITAIEVAATGIDWAFSPCVAVPRDERWGRTYEGFSEFPELVEIMAAASIRGYQGSDLSNTENILTCAKHFIADGGTYMGINEGDAPIDEQTLRSIHLPPYISAINEGVGSIMASFSSWNGVKNHGNKYLLTTVLKEELGFKGFVVSDWAGIDQLPGDYGSDIKNSVNAGIDMVMVPDKYKEFISTFRNLAENNEIPISRIDDAVRRILRVKFELGLFEKPYADRSLISTVGSSMHRKVARECVRQSLVLLKNENNILPISKKVPHIHIAGESADNLGYQCGGWTISWQGGSGDITIGTTILEAIKNVVSENTRITFSKDGSGASGASVGIAVIGERPYAEGEGDRNDLELSEEDITVIKNLKKGGIPIVVILISGRPLIITDVLNDCDAFLAAWLPGTEGQGVADVLFGDYNPTGKLSYSWPRNISQIPINYGDNDYDPLFEYGFGLNY